MLSLSYKDTVSTLFIHGTYLQLRFVVTES